MRTFVLIGAALLTVDANMSGAVAASPTTAVSRPLDLNFNLIAPTTTHPMIKSSTFAAAPVPNLDEAAPTLRTLGPAQPEFSPGFFNTKRSYRGEGFTAGSTSQSEMQRHFKPTAGVNMSVPLQ